MQGIEGIEATGFSGSCQRSYKGEKVVLHHQAETYEYKIVSSATIEPTDVEVLKDRGENELTLITCTLDGQKRFVLKGIRINASKGKQPSDV